MSMVALSLICAIVSVNLARRDSQAIPVPAWVERLFLHKLIKLTQVEILFLSCGFSKYIKVSLISNKVNAPVNCESNI